MRGPRSRCAAISSRAWSTASSSLPISRIARDAIGEEKREDEVGAIGGRVIEVDMGVHVP